MGATTELVCEFCGKRFNDPRGLGGHRAWCKENPNRRTKRAGKVRRSAAAAPTPAPEDTDGHGPTRTDTDRGTHNPLPEPPADPPGSTRSAAGRLHRADNSPDRLALADASIRDLEAALRAKLLGVRREIDNKLRVLGYVEVT